jgi:hypothetical protein
MYFLSSLQELKFRESESQLATGISCILKLPLISATYFAAAKNFLLIIE